MSGGPSSAAEPRAAAPPVFPRGRVGPTNPFTAFPREALERSIPDRFEEMAQRGPDRLAIKTRTQAVAYAELNRYANRLAHAVLAHGSSRGETVALLLEKDVWAVAAILGVLKAGCIYVPLDPAFPRERIRSIVDDAQACLIVTDDRNVAVAQEVAPPGLPRINVNALDPGLPGENPGLGVPPDAIAYILYTSGSSGEPKGVFQTHQNVLHAIMTHTNSMHLGADDRVSLLYSCSLNGAIRCIFGALLNGGSLFPFDLREDGLASLAPWMIRERITVYQSVPTVFRNLVRTLTGEEVFSGLRLLYLGGEPVYVSDVDLYRRHFPAECLFVNGWGPTESTVGLLYFLDKQTALAGPVVPVGFPVDDTEILLLDEGGNGSEEYGEIAVRSAYLARGYWRKPDISRAAFLPDPDGGSRRVYRTGDLGRRLPDGSIGFVGRKDSQVKVRGFRIELAEVEATLAAHPAVRESVVLAREDSPGDDRLVAYVVFDGTPQAACGLRAFAAQKLPSSMVPSAYVALDALPRTPTGKVDRRALPAPDRTRPDLGTAFVAPRTPTEDRLAAIWMEVLGIDRVGVHDSFFDLGGHSVLAARIAARVLRTFRIEVPLRSLFEAPTVAEMAMVIAERQAMRGGGEAILRFVTDLEGLSEDDAQRLLAPGRTHGGTDPHG